VGELNVLSNNFSAEYAGVLNIRVNTKSGGAQNHGSLFYNDVNSGLAANQMLGTVGASKPHSNFTQTGGSWGGPIPKLKNTFFFMAYEYWNQAYPIAESNVTGVICPPRCRPATFPSSISATIRRWLRLPQTRRAAQPLRGCRWGHALPPGATVVTGVPSSVQNPLTSKLVSLYFPQNIPDNGVGTTDNSRSTL
jgi:hypothetical protein